MRRFPGFTAVVGTVAITTLFLTGCGSDKAATKTSETTSAASVETTAVAGGPATEVPATEPAVVETVAAAADTVAATPDTVAAPAATDKPVAADTVAVAAADTVAGPSGADVAALFIPQLVMSMTGETTADPADVKCISEKVPAKDLNALVNAGGPTGAPDAMRSLLKAAFSCRPKGLVAKFSTDTFKDMPADVTVKQKECIQTSVFDLFATDDAAIDSMIANSGTITDELKDKFKTVLDGCVPPGATHDLLLKDLTKQK
jgi:hypothetical protein